MACCGPPVVGRNKGKGPAGSFKPVSVYTPATDQSPRTAADVDWIRKASPVWRTHLMDFDGPFGWSSVSADGMRKIQTSLKSYESMKWQDIDSKKSCGAIELRDVDAKSRAARTRLVAIGYSQFETLYKLRVDTKSRIWGIRDRHVFQLLWWDPDHQVYPMNIADN